MIRNKNIFRKSNFPTYLRAGAILVLGLTFVYIDGVSRLNYIRKYVVSGAAEPVLSLSKKPVQIYNSITNKIVSNEELAENYAKLQEENLLLRVKLMQLSGIKEENEQLKSLLNAPIKNNDSYRVAKLLADPNHQDNKFFIDHGSVDNIKVKAAVVDSNGVVGQVSEIFSETSTVTLLTDKKSAIPVTDQRSKVNAIVVGRGSSELLSLLHVPITSDVKVGDMLFTSGMGGKYPSDFPVAKIISVERLPSAQFAEISAVPTADLQAIHNVLLVSRSKKNDDE